MPDKPIDYTTFLTPIEITEMVEWLHREIEHWSVQCIDMAEELHACNHKTVSLQNYGNSFWYCSATSCSELAHRMYQKGGWQAGDQRLSWYAREKRSKQ